MGTNEGPRSSVVDQPILNNPFEMPKEYWVFDEGLPRRELGRRPAGYWRTSRKKIERVAVTAEEFFELREVNKIRKRVHEWKKNGYPGVTRITLELLRKWNDPERNKKLFFCQLEAAETIIWLTEARESETQGIVIPGDVPNDTESIEKEYKALRRYCCKMATGSGKTVVMAMIIAWSVLNKLYNKQDRRFSDSVLVVCPNLTVKNRLQVLLPTDDNAYYKKFDLVPPLLIPSLSKGRIFVTNWHLFQPPEESNGVVKKGLEGDSAFCKRILKDLWSKNNILVLNDEAHHAYRPNRVSSHIIDDEVDSESKSDDQKYDINEAKVWIKGLDRINNAMGINFCLDMSATPYFLQGSGNLEGSPFPWIVSDFGLVDAIESGIVKIPRVPVDTNSGRPIPEYFELWKWIMEKLPWSERKTSKRGSKPEAVLREVDGALSMLASEWKKTFDSWLKDGVPVPPVMIIICDTTNLSELLTEKIVSGRVLPELKNEEDREVTMRIDSKLIGKAESRLDDEKRTDRAKRLREKVSTVGKEGQSGANIRCVVSVGMLTEGWDAQNVKQILGIRAFKSQLLCEQVVGRGLRKVNYDDFTIPEYVDVYGIPFEVIPVAKSQKGERQQSKLGTKVMALPERQHLEIRFPRVDGYVFDIKHKIICDVKNVPELNVSPIRDPTEIIVKDAVGYRIGRPDKLGPGTEVSQTRDEFYKNHRLQTTIFEIASDITERIKRDARQVLFPQVLQISKQFVEDRVTVPNVSVRKEEIALQNYRDQIISRLSEAIRPDITAGESPLLPIIERYRPYGSTSEVSFRSFKECYGTTKSHVSHVVSDSNWEKSVMFQLEKLPEVVTYVKNDHLNFEIPYEFGSQKHRYVPDYIIHLQTKNKSILKVILEVKGFEDEKARAKHNAMQKWIDAVNHHGEFGRWVLIQCKDPDKVEETLLKLVK